MENNEEREETTTRNEWEVVSLTQSAYAAAPDSRQVDLLDDSSAEFVAETSDPMLMSEHFGFPPNQLENAALQPDKDVILYEQGSEEATPESVADKGVNSVLQGSSMVDKEQNFFSSFHSEEPMGVSASTEENNILAEPVELVHQGIDSGICNLPKAKDEDNNDAENLPCQAWWKRRAVSLIAHAKDANTFWSIFFAAAVMGLVVIGQRWRLERWQVLQMKWQFGGHDEIISRAFVSPISRLKEMIGSGRRGSFIRGSASTQR